MALAIEETMIFIIVPCIAIGALFGYVLGMKQGHRIGCHDGQRQALCTVEDRLIQLHQRAA